MVVRYYDSKSATTPLYTEDFGQIQLMNDRFNVQLGSVLGGFPAGMDFTTGYFMGVSLNDGPELTPRTAMDAAPYAINAATVGGIAASKTPVTGMLWPVPVDANGLISTLVLPSSLAGLRTINGTAPDGSGNIQLRGGLGVSVAQAPGSISISASNDITQVVAGRGLSGGGNTGDVTLGIPDNGIVAGMIQPGAIIGHDLDPSVAGPGLLQNQLGNLGVAVDNTTLKIVNNQLTIGTIPAGNISGNFQARVTGAAAPGSFLQAVNADGSVTTGTVATDGSLTATPVGRDISLAINPANSNSFTVPQQFNGGLSASNLSAGSVNASTVSAGSITSNGMISGVGILNTATFLQNGSMFVSAGSGTVSFGGSRLEAVGNPSLSTDAATKAYVDGSIGAVTLGGDINGSTGTTVLNPSNPGFGNRLIQGINTGTTTINDAAISDALTISGGRIDNTPIGAGTASTGAFTTLTSTGLTTGNISSTGTLTLGSLSANAPLRTGVGGVLTTGSLNLATEVSGSLSGLNVIPDFGAQNVLTTGNITTSAGVLTSGSAGHAGALVLNNGLTGASAHTSTLSTAALSANRVVTVPDRSGTLAITSVTGSTDIIALQPNAPQMLLGNGNGINLDVNGSGGDAIRIGQGARDLFTIDNAGNMVIAGTLSLTQPTGGHYISYDGAAAGVNPGLTIDDNATGADLGSGLMGLGIGLMGSPDVGIQINSQSHDVVLQGATGANAAMLLIGSTTGTAPAMSIGTGYQNGINAIINKTAAGHYAVRGEESGSANGGKVYGVWGIASNTSATNIASIGVRADGNGNQRHGQTNTALDIHNGELTMARQATDAQDNVGTNLIAEDDATASDIGPSGVVQFTSANTIAAPTAFGVRSAVQTIFNIYASPTSIILVTPMDAGGNIDNAHEVVTAKVENRLSGQFSVRVSRLGDNVGSTGSAWQPKIGFIIVNAAK